MYIYKLKETIREVNVYITMCYELTEAAPNCTPKTVPKCMPAKFEGKADSDHISVHISAHISARVSAHLSAHTSVGVPRGLLFGPQMSAFVFMFFFVTHPVQIALQRFGKGAAEWYASWAQHPGS